VPSTTGFRGVSAERLPDHLVLTTQMTAGWYRYVMRWRFYLDGRIVPWFGFAAIPASCVSFNHTHHNYWRLDFDIDGPASDAIQMGRASGPIGPDGPFKPIGREQQALWSPSYHYVVRDLVTRRGYRVVPGPSVAADTFAVSDSWAFQYKANELDDAGQGGGCPLNFNNFLNSEAIDDQDVVLWVRGGQFHAGGDQDDCGVAQFVLEPFGNWAP
jgi:Cu2+-containing amine oxidase